MPLKALLRVGIVTSSLGLTLCSLVSIQLMLWDFCLSAMQSAITIAAELQDNVVLLGIACCIVHVRSVMSSSIDPISCALDVVATMSYATLGAQSHRVPRHAASHREAPFSSRENEARRASLRQMLTAASTASRARQEDADPADHGDVILQMDPTPSSSPTSPGQQETAFCVICLDEMREHDVAYLQCFHAFHEQCILRWLEAARIPMCPLCNHVQQLTTDAYEVAIADRMSDTATYDVGVDAGNDAASDAETDDLAA